MVGASRTAGSLEKASISSAPMSATAMAAAATGWVMMVLQFCKEQVSQATDCWPRMVQFVRDTITRHCEPIGTVRGSRPQKVKFPAGGDSEPRLWVNSRLEVESQIQGAERAERAGHGDERKSGTVAAGGIQKDTWSSMTVQRAGS